MLFSKTITVPADTAASAKVTEKIKISRGVIHQVGVLFPDGCNGMVKVTLHDGGHQFSPSTEGMDYIGSGQLVLGQEHYKPEAGTNQIAVKAWSPDTTYNHEITVYLWILPENILLPTLIFLDIRNALILLLRKIGVKV